MGIAIMTKLHQGELIKMLKEKSGVTYRELSDGIGKSDVTIQTWEKLEEVTPANQNLIATFFGIDKRAFVNVTARELELAKIKHKHLKSMVEEESVPSQMKELNQKLDKVQEELEIQKRLSEELLRLLKQQQKRKN